MTLFSTCPVCEESLSVAAGAQGATCANCGLLINVSAHPLSYSEGNGQRPPDENKMFWRRRNASRRLDIIERFRDGQAQFVDIGCGSGEMLLEACGRYASVLGFEVNRPLVEHARTRYQLDVRLDYFSAQILAAEKSERRVFSLCHVLEHLEDPKTLLREIRQAAQPGDLLYVEVPMHTGQSFREKRYAWNMWNVEHLMLFSPQALQFVVDRSGFTCLELGTRIFARGGESKSQAWRLFRKSPVAFWRAYRNSRSGVGVADQLIADYGYVLARVR